MHLPAGYARASVFRVCYRRDRKEASIRPVARTPIQGSQEVGASLCRGQTGTYRISEKIVTGIVHTESKRQTLPTRTLRWWLETLSPVGAGPKSYAVLCGITLWEVRCRPFWLWGPTMAANYSRSYGHRTGVPRRHGETLASAPGEIAAARPSSVAVHHLKPSEMFPKGSIRERRSRENIYFAVTLSHLHLHQGGCFVSSNCTP